MVARHMLESRGMNRGCPQSEDRETMEGHVSISYCYVRIIGFFISWNNKIYLIH